jgi:hypothetical protein
LTVDTFANSGRRNVAFSARRRKYRISIKSIHNGYGDATSEPEILTRLMVAMIPSFDDHIETGVGDTRQPDVRRGLQPLSYLR